MRNSREQVETEGGRLAGIATAVLLFICIVAVALYSYMKSVNPSMEMQDLLKFFKGNIENTVKEAQILYSFEFESAENPVFTIYDDFIAECNSSGIWFLNKKGEVVWSEPMVINNPIIKTNGSRSRLLVAGAGSGELCIWSGRAVVWRDKISEAILNADISEDGYVTVITESKRDNNEIRVYDPHGVELIRKIIANDFAVSADVAPSGKLFAVSGISAGAAAAFSSYKLYDLEGKELANTAFEATSELLPLFWFNKGNGIFAAGDRSAASIDKAGKIIWEKQFKSIAGAVPFGSDSMAAAVESDEGFRLVLYSAAGRELAAGRLEEKPAGLDAIRGTIAVNTFDTVQFYNDKCKNIGKFKADGQIKHTYFFDRYQAVIITGNKAVVISLN